MVEAANDKCSEECKQVEAERTKNLVMIENLVHPSVPISNDEVIVDVSYHMNAHNTLTHARQSYSVSLHNKACGILTLSSYTAQQKTFAKIHRIWHWNYSNNKYQHTCVCV